MNIEDDIRKKLNDEEGDSNELIQKAEETIYKYDNFHSENNNSDNITFNLDSITVKNLKTIILTNKITGILNMISGILASLTVIGLLTGVPTVLIGLKLLESSKVLENLQYNKKGEELRQYFESYGKACKYTLILMIIGIIFFILYIIFIIVIFGFFIYYI
ncbi:hypothetical protein EII29_00155 [Leptotrichia sp. OH3620_COT-345]|uniref:DUF5362 family protein n=1 Tax=Leptotrichia sp. OH3620_COT-345 TaxID=2491048 RepID=UPI000F64996D|nr:DUF5362 family protein [Leptotrichia sp. OH3620_COT-345]RRD40900.1 hypothetical protein EII29_00155 [Leptotrichia sp. OH3620_COT-345]